MEDFDWRGLIKTVAPTLATAFGGPLAGMATRAIAGALLGDEDATEAQVAEALRTAKPEDLLKLKQADQDFAARMKELDIELAKVDAGDRASARRRQAEMKDRMPAFIALAALAGFFGILAALMRLEIPPDAVAPLQVMLGALGGLVVQIGNYYFGSSAGSARKNELLAGLAKGGG